MTFSYFLKRHPTKESLQDNKLRKRKRNLGGGAKKGRVESRAERSESGKRTRACSWGEPPHAPDERKSDLFIRQHERAEAPRQQLLVTRNSGPRSPKLPQMSPLARLKAYEIPSLWSRTSDLAPITKQLSYPTFAWLPHSSCRRGRSGRRQKR